MRWFKHFSDNHRGRSIQYLMDEMGHVGPCSYYFLVEMCAEKLEQKQDKSLESSDCLFSFHQRIVRQNLRISLTNLRRLLDICQTFGLLSFEFRGTSIEIKMPMLLDLLEYDQKKSRARRAQVAPESRLEKNREEKSRVEKIHTSPKRKVEVVEAEKDLNKKVWESFKNSYESRYKVEPVRNASINAKISQLAKRLGPDSIEIVRFFVLHNEPFYLKNLHAIGLCLKDAESLHTQWKRGKAITSSDVRAFEKNNDLDAQLERLAK